MENHKDARKQPQEAEIGAAPPGSEGPAPEPPPEPAPEPAILQTQFLIRQHQDGDRQAFTDLWARHQDQVRKAIASRLGYRVRELFDIDDILQETYLAAWKGIEEGRFHDFSTVGSFRNLLVKIALNKIVDAGRRIDAAKCDKAREEPLPETDSRLPGRDERPSQILRAQEMQEIWDHYLLWLTDQERTVIDMIDNLGMTHGEVGEELGCSEQGARKRYSRARQRLRQLVQKRLGTESSMRIE